MSPSLVPAVSELCGASTAMTATYARSDRVGMGRGPSAGDEPCGRATSGVVRRRSSLLTQMALRELLPHLASDPRWIAAGTERLTAAIHAELPRLDVDPEMRAATHASSES